MKHEKDIFNRMDLQQLCSFLLNGEESGKTETLPYDERLAKSTRAIYNKLESLCADNDELDEALTALSDAFAAYEAVYTEIGMKFGANLVFQLLNKDNCAD